MFILAGKLPLCLLSFIFICLIHTTTTLAQDEFIAYNCQIIRKYTVNSTYQKNLNITLSALPTTNNGFGFYNHSTGYGYDAVKSVALCRGDMTSPDVCGRCLSDSIVKLLQVCPNHKEAIGYYDYCMLRYYDEQTLDNTEETLYMSVSDAQNAKDFDRFSGDLGRLMMKLRGDAAAGGPLLKFATGNTISSNSLPIYGLVQCTPDLLETQCSDCLGEIINKTASLLQGKVGGKLYTLTCYLRYETFRFTSVSEPVFQPSPSPSPSPPPPLRLPIPQPSPSPPPLLPPIPQPSPSGKKNHVISAKIITVIVIVIAVVIISSFCMIMRFRKKKKQITPPSTLQSNPTMDIGTLESLQYDFHTVKAATNGFSEENKLGQGGFGTVYKGTLEEGHQIAVKRLALNSRQGDLEFKNEVLLVAKLQHRNLVRLLGFSTEGSERLLIYEFMPKGSLDEYLFDLAKRTYLDWEKRYNIIKGIAKGLLYLHEDSHLRIVHRDMKASNVLLDAQMTPKIADFGTARLFKTEETQRDTSRIVGTYGYMAPEYVLHGQFSMKSDVYSYGVLVLEMVTGQKNQSFQNGENLEYLLSFAWKSWQNGTTSNIIDPTLRTGSHSLCEIIRSIHIGLLCVQENAIDRPTMASIVTMLNSLSMTLPLPAKPAFFTGHTINPGKPALQENTINEVSLSDVFPR